MLLPRDIDIEVAINSWPHGQQVPAALLPPRESDTVDVAVVLNLIGVLTTPALSGGASLSEMWAFVRYLFAVTTDDDLRLTSDFQSMDAHQKTILSDDFGMGFTMHWLAQRLGLVAACDGRYFIENHLMNIGGVYNGGAAKRGLGKAPDFVAIDQNNRLHVIECKGTQSSRAYRNSQLRDSARIQKTTIVLPAHLAGERLAAGIYIAGPTGDRTELRITDPDRPEKYVVRDEDPRFIRSAVVRGTLAKKLRSSGLSETAAAVAYPKVRPDLDRPGQFAEDERSVSERRERGETEARSRSKRTFQANNAEYVGRRGRLEFPRPIFTRRGEYLAIEIRQGIRRARFDEIAERSLDPEPFNDGEVEALSGEYRFGENQGRAWVKLGEDFYSDLRLLRS
jgi:hypothetical protein